MTMHHRIFLVFTVLWMLLIFLMSAQPAPESTATSLTVGRMVCTVFVPGYRNMSAVEQLRLAKKIDHPVRKTAHATEYAILAILVFLAISYCRKRTYLHSLCISITYAVSDEIHQYFVPGRACMVTDIVIDSSGALAGLFLVFLLKRIRNQKHERRR
ncbi:MAG: VanZ family protein [Lachnospiraceae bacterium]|nr:VanZ family protein [Lachnospiraceae bacterium]MDY2760312.1 VanZ family protein [Lachnospiraceae bacterium]